ncbi:hypothetical protein VAZ01S_012_00390 [Vibrio azureus NBRC 104587]|uniref:Lipocalin/cytosolic fatty-acid binding domain-containing protein n=2 Tax=Vibrio azureus TaxID=512649 RepID=U3BZ40_9VIBR|nr:hypothetical protein VAZ01S_012_00390 [Vibrio azureus NBRC 104587]
MEKDGYKKQKCQFKTIEENQLLSSSLGVNPHSLVQCLYSRPNDDSATRLAFWNLNINYDSNTGLYSAGREYTEYGSYNVVEPVTSFDVNQYLGSWYEIARIDSIFEQGLSKGRAFYTLKDDGMVEVTNKGWNDATNQWQEAKGTAYLAGEPNVGYLRVAFFWPFYGDYRIFHLEPDYSVALVSGSTTDYFWLLSRTPTLSQERIEYYLDLAEQNGIKRSSIVIQEQN